MCRRSDTIDGVNHIFTQLSNLHSHCLICTIGQPPDLSEPVVLSTIRKGTKIKSLCANVSSQMLRDFNFALVWGTSTKHSPQRCGVEHQLDDEDVVQIVTKTNSQQRQDKNYQSMVQGFSDKYHKKKYDAKKVKQTKLRG